MKSFNNLSRRKFLQSTAGLSYVFLSGVGRVKAQPYQLIRAEDYSQDEKEEMEKIEKELDALKEEPF